MGCTTNEKICSFVQKFCQNQNPPGFTKTTRRIIGDLWRGPIDLLELLLVLGRFGSTWLHLLGPPLTKLRFEARV